MKNDTGKMHVDVFKLADGADRALYEDLLNKNKDGKIKIIKEHLTQDRLGNPIISVWYSDN